MKITPKNPEVIEHMLTELANLHGKGLTKWEEDFIESISDQFDQRGSLSDRQFEILERIYADRT